MVFINVENGVVLQHNVSDRELRTIHGNVALPADLSNCDYLIDRNWFVMAEVPMPVVDQDAQFVTAGAPVVLNGAWTNSWEINNYTAEQIAATQAAKLESLKQQLTNTVTQHLNNKAKELGYDNEYSICTYTTSTVPEFYAEANGFVAWRDLVWATCIQIQTDALAGTRPIPTMEQLIAELPIFSL